MGITKQDLELIPTEDLQEELKNRFDGTIIMGAQLKINAQDDKYYWTWRGGHALCIGLARLMEEKIQRDYHENKC